MMKKILAILMALSLLLSVSAVYAENEAEDAVVETTSTEPVLLVTLNGEQVYSDNEYLSYVSSYYMDLANSYGYDTSDPELLATIRQGSMLYTLQSLLILQKAKELGLDQVTDEEKANFETEAKEQWVAIVEDFSSQYITEDSSEDDKIAARADALSQLMNMGYDEETYVKEYVEGEIKDLMISHVRDYLVQGKTITDEDIQAHYEELVNTDKEAYEKDIASYEYYTRYYGKPAYFTPEGYRSIIHILLPVDAELLNNWKDLAARLEEQTSDTGAESTVTEETATNTESTPEPEAEEEPVTEEMVKAAEQAILDSVQSTVDEIKAKLAAGSSFEELIKEYGIDPGMQDDATRAEGYPVHEQSILYDPAFTAAAMKLEKIGDIGDPIVGQNGVHILQYLKDVQGGALELTDDLKEELRFFLEDNMRTEALDKALAEWMSTSEIVYTVDGEPWKIPEESEETESVEDLVPEN